MKRWVLGALAALLLMGQAEAADLHVDGLGTLPFSAAVSVTDGGGTAVEAMMRQNMASPKGEKTKRSRLMRFLTVPDGMTFTGTAEDSPSARARIYQLEKREMRGVYTMLVIAFSGDGDEFFPKDRKRAAFWDAAFSGKAGDTLFGGARQPLITLDEFRRAARAAMGKGKGEPVDFTVLSASPWKRYTNGDGTLRWQQQVKITVTNDAGLVVPMWIESVMYRNPAGRYYFLIFTGSHMSGSALGDDILYALYQLEREKL